VEKTKPKTNQTILLKIKEGERPTEDSGLDSEPSPDSLFSSPTGGRPPRQTFSFLRFVNVLQFQRMAGTGANSIRVMGIDPGLNITGYGIIERRRQGTALVEAGVIRLPRADGNNLPLRLETLFKGVQEVVEEFRPEVVCLEEVYSHADYPQTAVLMGHARGVICLAARLARVPVFPMPAKRIKQSVTGNGNASKLQVQRAVQQHFSLGVPPRPSDVADALAVALCYLNTLRIPTNGVRLKRGRLR
jgi:crossover junction endodeoxyribonuclease RuvC